VPGQDADLFERLDRHVSRHQRPGAALTSAPPRMAPSFSGCRWA